MRSKELLISGASLFALTHISKWAFTRHVRAKIAERANWCSEMSGESHQTLQAAHIDHTKGTPHYNNPSNGVFLTIEEHLKDHVIRAGRNGLSQKENEFAINSLYTQIYHKMGPKVAQEALADAYEIARDKEKSWPVDELSQKQPIYHQKEHPLLNRSGMNGD